jgi:hypothetical protein
MTGQSNLIHDMRTRIKVEDYGLENVSPQQAL